MIDADSSIYLHQDPKKVENNESRLDLHMASALKEFGLVKHILWVEKFNSSLLTERQRK
jgi:hypothetical protein